MAQPARWREELRNELALATFTLAAFFVLSITTTLLAWRPDNVSALRLGGALLLGVMLRRQPGVAASALYLLPGLLAMVISQHIAGRAWLPAMLLGGARLLEIGIAYALLRRLGEDGTALQELPALGRLMLVTVFIAPVVGA